MEKVRKEPHISKMANLNRQIPLVPMFDSLKLRFMNLLLSLSLLLSYCCFFLYPVIPSLPTPISDELGDSAS